MATSKSIIALIPARSGSRRVKHKNIRLLAGHPVIAYTIAAALEAKIFSAVVVSTDLERYAEIARYYGAEVPFLRPSEFADELSPDIEWVEYSLRRLREEGRVYDCFSILRPTSPFRKAETIQRAWQEFLAEAGVDSLRAVEMCKQHPAKMWVVRGKRMMPLHPLGPPEQPWHSSQYQALPEVYVQNASLEIALSSVVFSGRTISGHILMPFFTRQDEGFDVNSEEDWVLAEHYLRTGKATLPGVARQPFKLAQPIE